jgi:hypothetical protein
MSDPNDVRFEGRVHSAGARIGIVVGAALLFVVGAVAAMGASPSPSAGTNQDLSPGASGAPGGAGPGQRGFGMHGMPGDGGWQFDGDLGKGGVRGGGPFGQITIASIDGSKLSLNTDDGWTRTITVASSTTITRGGQAAALSDLKVGDAIRFAQTRNSDGTFTITKIAVVVPTVAGTVTDVSSSGFTIKARNGLTRTIQTSSATTFRLGTGTGSKSDVKVGSEVLVAGNQNTDGSLSALTVVIDVPRIMGEVTAKSGNTITIQRADGLSTKVTVDSSTTYTVRGSTSASLNDITVGMRILVEGTQQSDGSVKASAIHAGVGMGMRGPGGPWQQQPNASTAPSDSTSAG